VARLLGQSAISFLPPGADRWSLAFADGHHEVGGTLEEYPVIVAR
jgi:hypothetical protein